MGIVRARDDSCNNAAFCHWRRPSVFTHAIVRIPRGRPRAVGRDVRRPGRWDDDRRTLRRRRLVDGDRVTGSVSGDAHERTIDRGEQIEGGGRIIPRRLGQRVDTDHV